MHADGRRRARMTTGRAMAVAAPGAAGGAGVAAAAAKAATGGPFQPRPEHGSPEAGEFAHDPAQGFAPQPAATSMRPANGSRSKALRGRILRAAKPTPTAMANPAAGVVDGAAAGAIAATAHRATAISQQPRVRISTSVPTTTSGRIGRRREPATSAGAGASLCTAVRARASAGTCAAARGFGSRPAARARTRTAAPPLHGSRARTGFQRQRACGNSDADAGTAAARAGRDPARLRPTTQAKAQRLVGEAVARRRRIGLMQSRWVDRDAKAAVDRYAAAGISPELALRVYTTRLLGGDPKLVLHGGGNTSVKLRMPDLAGDEAEVLCVKGSGCDMAVIEPAGLPAVRLRGAASAPARAMSSPTRTWCACSAPICSIRWRQIRRSRRCCTHSCRTSSSITPMPTPCSAWSTSRTAPNSARRSMAARMGFVPYVMPGFRLAKAAAAVFDSAIRRSKA